MCSIKINREDLIVDIEKIPRDIQDIKSNIKLLLNHSKYLGKHSKVNDDLTKGILDRTPSYIFRQLMRLSNFKNDNVDLLAWVSRNLMELFFTLRYMYTSRDHYDEVIKEQLKDLKEIEEVIYPSSSNDDQRVKSFRANMQNMWETLEKYGVQRDDLKRPHTAKYYAEGSNLLHEYNRGWRIHSKYIHPTSFILFGKKDFVYSDDSTLFFLIIAQYYAAWNLRDIHGLIEKDKNFGST